MKFWYSRRFVAATCCAVGGSSEFCGRPAFDGSNIWFLSDCKTQGESSEVLSPCKKGSGNGPGCAGRAHPEHKQVYYWTGESDSPFMMATSCTPLPPEPDGRRAGKEVPIPEPSAAVRTAGRLEL